MNAIPQQPAGRDLCASCNEPTHLVNRAVEETWVHATGSEWCGLPGEAATTRAIPASRPWPERVA